MIMEGQEEIETIRIDDTPILTAEKLYPYATQICLIIQEHVWEFRRVKDESTSFTYNTYSVIPEIQDEELNQDVRNVSASKLKTVTLYPKKIPLGHHCCFFPHAEPVALTRVFQSMHFFSKIPLHFITSGKRPIDFLQECTWDYLKYMTIWFLHQVRNVPPNKFSVGVSVSIQAFSLIDVTLDICIAGVEK